MTAAPLDRDGLREVAKKQLSRAYYNGLDRKGWSDYEEKEAMDAIMQLAEEYTRSVCVAVIGEDELEMIGNTHMVTATSNNKLRAEQRKRLEDQLKGNTCHH